MRAAKARSVAAFLPIIGIASAVLAIIVTGVVAIVSIRDFQQRINRIGHTNTVISCINELSALMTEAQTATRGFVITGNERFVAPFEVAQALLPTRIAALDRLIADNPQQHQALALLKVTLQQSLLFDQTVLQLRRNSQDGTAAMVLIAKEEGENVMQGLRNQAAQMIRAEQELLTNRSSDTDAGVQRTEWLISLGSLLGVVTSAGAFLLLRAENRRRRSADRALTSANAALKQHATQLEESNSELESFSYSISHDLRIPLRAISGYARMLEEDYGDKVDGEGQRLLSVIRDNSKRMGDLIDDLLAFSRFGRQSIQVAVVDMRVLVERAIGQLKRKDEFANTRIDIGELPLASGDRALLQQVWLNLISNALKYSGTRDAPVVEIVGAKMAEGVRYTVRDNGVGFDMKYYGKLFGVFQRLHSAEVFHGTGVGLAISHRIVTRHGGRIWCEAVLDHGASFSFVLPHRGVRHE